MTTRRTKLLLALITGWLMIFANSVSAVYPVSVAGDDCDKGSMECCITAAIPVELNNEIIDPPTKSHCKSPICVAGCTIAIHSTEPQPNEIAYSVGAPQVISAPLIGISLPPEFQPPKNLLIF